MASPYSYGSGNPGGFVNPKEVAKKPKDNKVKWTAENDAKLYPAFFKRDIAPFEWAVLAAQFPEKPSIKAIKERVQKLRVKRDDYLQKNGIVPFDKSLHPKSVEEYIEKHGTKSYELPKGVIVVNEEDPISDDEESGSAFTPTVIKGTKKRKESSSTTITDDDREEGPAFPPSMTESTSTMGPPPVKRSRIESNDQPVEKPTPGLEWMPADARKIAEEQMALKAKEDEDTGSDGAVAGGEDSGAAESDPAVREGAENLMFFAQGGHGR